MPRWGGAEYILKSSVKLEISGSGGPDCYVSPLEWSWLQIHPAAESLWTKIPAFLFDHKTLIYASLSVKVTLVTLHFCLTLYSLNVFVFYD
jgi:hypothetical protein